MSEAPATKRTVFAGSDRSHWETPASVFEPLHRKFAFTLDAAATANNTKCRRYLEDAFEQRWSGRVFLNPPYGRQLKDWTLRAQKAVLTNECSVVVALLPARVDTRWYHDYCKQWPHRLIRGRITFELYGEPLRDGKGRPMPAPFPCMLVYFGL